MLAALLYLPSDRATGVTAQDGAHLGVAVIVSQAARQGPADVKGGILRKSNSDLLPLVWPLHPDNGRQSSEPWTRVAR